MLVVSNGAFKSGSTWLFNIARCLTSFPPPPKEFRNSEWVNPSINPEKLRDFLQSTDLKNNNYLAKNHFGTQSKRDLLLSAPHTKILDITRDLRDVVVSAYYHYRLKEDGYEDDFDRYYWTRGRFVAKQVRQYHHLWEVSSEQVYVSSFRSLKRNFASECRSIADFLGCDPLTEEDIHSVHNDTSLDSLRSKYDDDRFFRKGEQGDWENHLTPRMLADIKKIKDGHYDDTPFLIELIEKVRYKSLYLADWIPRF